MFANGDGMAPLTIIDRLVGRLVETRWHSSDTNEKIRSIIVVSHSKNM